jgi:transcriptional antiterminator/mannitol/fructose-specific phosphotransferase system IIA component (Ntr-type)
MKEGSYSEIEAKQQLLLATQAGLIEHTSNRHYFNIQPVSPKNWAQAAAKVAQIPNYSEAQRIAIIYLLSYSEMAPTSVYYFQTFLDVSKGTVLNDIKKLRAILNIQQIRLNYSRKAGFKLEGAEIDIRANAKNWIATLNEQQSGRFALVQWLAEIDLTLFAKTRDQLLFAIHDAGLSLVFGRIDELTFFLAGSAYRIQERQVDLLPNFDLIVPMKSYRIGRDFVQNLTAQNVQPSRAECAYVTAAILTTLRGELKDTMADKFLKCAVDIVKNMEDLMAVEFHNYRDLLTNVFYHLVPAYFRITMHFYLPNVLIDNIKSQYHDIYHFTGLALRPLEQMTETKTPAEEIGFFALLFGGMIFSEDEARDTDSRLKAVIVCPNGTSSSVILQSELGNIFPTIDFFATSSTLEFENIQSEDYDLIFSTVKLECHTDKKVFIVSPLMSPLEKNQLIIEVQKQVTLPGISLITAKDVISALKPYIQVKSGVSNDKLYDVINKAMNKNIELEEDDRPMLTDLITPEMVQVSDKYINDWTEAIRLAARPLVDYDFVEPRYVDAMIEKVNHYGAFIHIGKGIALPHARPEEGAKRIGMSVLKLKHPVYLLDDPEHEIKLFICLSAVDNNTHLRALASLTNILSEEDLLNELLTANTQQSVLNVFKKGE